MLKKLVDKRIELFKTIYPNYKISKKGNYYIEIGDKKENSRIIQYTGYNVTKGLIDKLGTAKEVITHQYDYVLLMTPRGVFKILHNKRGKRASFKNFTMKDLTYHAHNLGHPVADIFFVGRKYEYLRDYPNLHRYRIAQNFTSLKELKCFLGFDFINDDEFYNLICIGNNLDQDIIKWLIKAESKSNIHRLITRKGSTELFTLLEDYERMCGQQGLKMEIPAGYNKLKELHDEVVYEKNKGRIDSYSDTQVYSMRPIDGSFETKWNDFGITFKQLNTPRELFIRGLKQNHCIGSYGDDLDSYAFYTLTWKGVEYDLMISKEGMLRQFHGSRNSHPPVELYNFVNQTVPRFKLVHMMAEEPEGYPWTGGKDYDVWPIEEDWAGIL
jgi:hypothetical protein